MDRPDTLRRTRGRTTVLLLVWAALLAGCGGSSEGPDAASDGRLLTVDLDKSDPEQLLRYYFGGYAEPNGGDPFAVGLLIEKGGAYYVDVEVLEARHSDVAEVLRQAAAGDGLDWDELSGFLEATYYAARGLPETLAALRAERPYDQDATPWFVVELDGVMTTARRRVFVDEAALRQALRSYRANGDRLLYPVGTTLVGEHRLDGRLIETTAMRKRNDGFWDFFTYGEDGTLAGATASPPRSLRTPTQCVGCHLGSKLFEPERSFPAHAVPGPHGPRALYVPEAWREAEVVSFFDEHRKRSDTVLGLYNTLFVARLRAARTGGTLSPEDAQLLAGLGL